jgi:hypothetical protein
MSKMIAMVFFMVFALPKNILTYLYQRETAHVKAFWKGCMWNATHLSNGNKLKLFA